MKKYKVKKKYPKPIMNSGRLVFLEPGQTKVLKHEKMVEILVKRGVLKEVIEHKKKDRKPKRKSKPMQPKQAQSKSKDKHKKEKYSEAKSKVSEESERE